MDRGKRVATPKKDEVGWKVASLGLSVFALLISGTAAYINTFRTVDELKILIEEPPHFGLAANVPDIKNSEVSVDPHFDAILINSGGRSLVVLEMHVMLLQERFVGGDPKCIYGSKMPTDFQPLVLKEKEVTQVHLYLLEGPNGGHRAAELALFGFPQVKVAEKNRPILFQTTDVYKSTHRFTGSLCLVIKWATPRESSETPLLMSEIKDEERVFYVGKGFPATVVTRRVSSVFNLY